MTGIVRSARKSRESVNSCNQAFLPFLIVMEWGWIGYQLTVKLESPISTMQCHVS